ncbi:MAG: hypothetical protein KY445_17035, partial [Armatimonadetes bacterium]|nr:hypothetical protein [Armatimonadota bacterium]
KSNHASQFNPSPYSEPLPYFRSLPVRCGIVQDCLVESWGRAAQQGMFVYDYSSETSNYGNYTAGKPYRLITSPLLPLTSPELPLPIQEWLRPIAFKSLDFTQAHELFPEAEFSDIIVQNKGLDADGWGTDTHA